MAITKEYQADLQGKHARKIKWGTSAVRYGGPDIVGLIRRFHHTRIIDFGCGKGQLEGYVTKNNNNLGWRNYDPGIPEYANVPNENSCDMLVSCDVLEHVEPHLLDQTIQEMWSYIKVGGMMYINVPCTPTGDVFTDGPYKGQNIHLTVEQPDWWRDKIESNCRGFSLWTFSDWIHKVRSGARRRVTLVLEKGPQ